MSQKPADTYSPLYFLASLGAGGLSVTFFMYLMFWVPHVGRPVPVFEDITAAFVSGALPLQAAIIIAVVGILLMTFLNVKSLLWNISALNRFKKTDAYRSLRASNAETTLLAAPLASAMTINALFIVGLVFVPGLWSIIEYLFPLALLAFGAVGVWALKLIGQFLGRVLSEGGIFDMTAHNSFAQLLPAFALAMVGVGFSAPAAMSLDPTTVALSLITSTFFAVASLIYTVVALITAFGSMLHHGTAREAGPTLMVIVPIVTVLSILFLRQDHGLHTSFQGHATAANTMLWLAQMISVQVVFLLLGLTVLIRQNYFSDFVFGSKTSPGSYALICPGVAFSVLLQFFVNKGLVTAGVIAEFGAAYWGITAIALISQALMVLLILSLNKQHFSANPEGQAIAAE
ncbi:TsoY family (seleno)protein [Lentibacter sp.]|uniref:TsoY family (seleno)protein n=1 Tax=Lentibacter sp. TaxID=2024994 RepID=UPI003F69553A